MHRVVFEVVDENEWHMLSWWVAIELETCDLNGIEGIDSVCYCTCSCLVILNRSFVRSSVFAAEILHFSSSYL